MFSKFFPEKEALKAFESFFQHLEADEILKMIHQCVSPLDYVRRSLVQRGAKVGNVAETLLARMVAGHVDEVLVNRAKSQILLEHQVKDLNTNDVYLVLHPFSWDFDVAQTILGQAWGRLGDERRAWLEDDSRGSVEQFGLGGDFSSLFTSPEHGIYEYMLTVSDGLEASLYKLRE